ncbi:MAG TPA: Uma2 family endonuclease [Pyrinomonadaceae bacterium]|nr:Uma2 family endonuclease [Pyrinomonadaceae bacterium]
MRQINTSPLVKTYTLEEFWELPEPSDYSKLELIAGVLYLTSHPDLHHSNIVSRLVRLLSDHLLTADHEGNLCVPRTGILSKPSTWLEPDFFYVTSNTTLNGEYYTTADLVVEVISEESAIYDRNTKADTYAALRVKELWLVDPLSRRIEVRVLKGEEYESIVVERNERLTSTVLPELEFKVGDVFGD